MRSALLRGSEHTKLGAIAALGEGRCAIALSRGGYKKGYAHQDPNEDATGFAFGPGGALLAVADGHHGCQAAELAVAQLLARYAEAWTGAADLGDPWSATAREALAALHLEIIERGIHAGSADARTTLALALARPGEDRLAFASLGDSHIFVAEATAASDLARGGTEPPVYLGSPSLDPDELAARAVVGTSPLAGTRALALATDGLSERGIGLVAPEHAVLDSLAHAERSRPELGPLDAARRLVECALAAHRDHRAGDNIAAAVWIA